MDTQEEKTATAETEESGKPAENPAAKLSNGEVGDIVRAVVERAAEFLPATLAEGDEPADGEEQYVPVPMTASELAAVRSAGARCTAIECVGTMLEHQTNARNAMLDLKNMTDTEVANASVAGGVMYDDTLKMQFPIETAAQAEAAKRLRAKDVPVLLEDDLAERARVLAEAEKGSAPFRPR